MWPTPNTYPIHFFLGRYLRKIKAVTEKGINMQIGGKGRIVKDKWYINVNCSLEDGRVREWGGGGTDILSSLMQMWLRKQGCKANNISKYGSSLTKLRSGHHRITWRYHNCPTFDKKPGHTLGNNICTAIGQVYFGYFLSVFHLATIIW